jgi:hypothetical protein
LVANVLSFVGIEERSDDVGGGALEELKGLSGGRGWEDGRGVRSHCIYFASGVRIASGSVGVAVSGCEFARRRGRGKESRPDCVVGWVGVGGGQGEQGRVPAGEGRRRLVPEDEGLKGRLGVGQRGGKCG